MTRPNAVTVCAPGSIGNFGPGLDVIGCAVTGACDRVTVQRAAGEGLTIADPGAPELPRDAERHAAGLAAAAVLRRASARLGLTISCAKGLPLAGGQGGSAASAVAGAVATNQLLGAPLATSELLQCCLEAESAVAGRHLDNIAPCLLGGVVLVRSLDPIDVHPLPVPRDLWIVLVLPDQRLATAAARAVLPAHIARDTVIHQLAQVGAIVHALHLGDLTLLGAAMDDRIAEPARASLIPGFDVAKEAAHVAGALGASISGAGPTTFALCSNEPSARRVGTAMQRAFEAAAVRCTYRVARVDEAGARVVSAEGV
jgi:homoserine kinase